MPVETVVEGCRDTSYLGMVASELRTQRFTDRRDAIVAEYCDQDNPTTASRIGRSLLCILGKTSKLTHGRVKRAILDLIHESVDQAELEQLMEWHKRLTQPLDYTLWPTEELAYLVAMWEAGDDAHDIAVALNIEYHGGNHEGMVRKSSSVTYRIKVIYG